MSSIRRKIKVLILGMLIGVSAMAQSATDIELAKKLAKQQGYSDAQIEAMMKQQSGNAPTGTKKVNQPIDRNIAVQQQYSDYEQQRLKSNYGVSGEQNRNQQDNPLQNLFDRNMVPEKKDELPPVFGHDLFNNPNLNFVPNYNMPTPDNYILAPGDEVIVDIWGNVITSITATLTPDGSINIPDLGPVYLAGQSVAKAEKSLKEYLSKIYSGISDPTPGTFVKLALGKIRSISVNVVGDVKMPGSYTLPSLSTIASVMYLAGGPSKIGTIREIKLYRRNKLVSTFDLYEFMIRGVFDTNLRLEDNDVIAVGPYAGIATLEGGVKRPMRYEVKNGESLDNVLACAGGFAEDAYSGLVHIERISANADKTGAVATSFDVPKDRFSTFQVLGGDKITVLKNEKRFDNKVKIAGAVWRPGSYSIAADGNEKGVSTLRQLITAAGGVKEEAYLPKAYIVRYGENRSKQQVSFSLQNVILGQDDVKLCPDDSVQVFVADSLMPKLTVKIMGEVNLPSGTKIPNKNSQEPETIEVEYEYRKGMTVGDLILKANGITDAATLSKVEIARRIANRGEDIRRNDTVALILHYNLLANPADADTKLEPFDIVFVRKSASYKPQQSILVEGEANYTGWHVIEKNTVRLSDVLAKAQGVTRDAYVKGAKLTRKLTKEEFERLKTAMQIARRQVADTTAIDSLEIGEGYDIAINLEEALQNPGSYADVVLRENDVITIPKFNNTVKISGAVLYPNTISYNPKYNWREYLSNAGGALQKAMTGKIYMVHMNGSVATRGARDFKVQPGTEIVVPAKERKPNSGQTLSAIMGVASSTASLAAMVVTIMNQVK